MTRVFAVARPLAFLIPLLLSPSVIEACTPNIEVRACSGGPCQPGQREIYTTYTPTGNGPCPVPHSSCVADSSCAGTVNTGLCSCSEWLLMGCGGSGGNAACGTGQRAYQRQCESTGGASCELMQTMCQDDLTCSAITDPTPACGNPGTVDGCRSCTNIGWIGDSQKCPSCGNICQTPYCDPASGGACACMPVADGTVCGTGEVCCSGSCTTGFSCNGGPPPDLNPTPPAGCNPTPWTQGLCGGGGCLPTERHLTRTVNQVGCAPTNDCVPDLACSTPPPPNTFDFNAECSDDGTVMTLRWPRDPLASSYDIRADADPIPWNAGSGTCAEALANDPYDRCFNTTAPIGMDPVIRTFSTTPGKLYNMWGHAQRGGTTLNSPGHPVRCPALATPIPVTDCNGNRLHVSWNAVTNAVRYALAVDDQVASPGFNAACTPAQTGDFCTQNYAGPMPYEHAWPANGATYLITLQAFDSSNRASNPVTVSRTCVANAPQGALKQADCTGFSGWACDLDDPNASVEVRLYNGSKSPANLIGADLITTDAIPAAWNAEVSAACGAGNTAHMWQVALPSTWNDGVARTVNVVMVASNVVTTGGADYESTTNVTIGPCTSPQGLCGTFNTICGTVRADETGNPTAGVVVELRGSAGGAPIKSMATTSGGTFGYVFTNLSVGTTYYVNPAIDRKQATTPSYQAAHFPSASSPSKMADFRVRGIPAQVTINSDAGGTFLIVSTWSYSEPNPPPVKANTPQGGSYYSSAIGPELSTTLFLPAGATYRMVCWKPVAHHGTVSYERVPALSEQPILVSGPGGTDLQPGQTYSGFACQDPTP